jgi:phosphoglycolate phosphatase
MAFPAVLFDLDGTLLDTLADIAAAANSMLAANGFPEHPLDAYRYLVGSGVTMLLRRALPPTECRDEVLARCAVQFREAYQRGWNVRTRAYDGISELLDALVERRVAMAVLSNKPDHFTKLAIKEYFPEVRFHGVIGDREGVPRKPNPASALELAGLLGVPAAQVLYLGDSAVDMQTAQAAGMVPVGALWGFRPRSEMEENGARRLIAHPLDLLPIVDGHLPLD